MHIAAWAADGGCRVQIFDSQRRSRRPSVARQLVECYPPRWQASREPGALPPEFWPALAELNPPLHKPPTASSLPEKLRRGHRIEMTQQLAATRERLQPDGAVQ